MERLTRERDDLEKLLYTSKMDLVKVSKSNEEKIQILNALSEKIDQLEREKVVDSLYLKELSRIITSQDSSESKAFQIYMDELNQEFIKRLKQSFDLLTVYDLRLCSFIRSGLSTREIANMSNVLPSSINVSRSRLRKKLQLNINQDLFTFLSKF